MSNKLKAKKHKRPVSFSPRTMTIDDVISRMLAIMYMASTKAYILTEGEAHVEDFLNTLLDISQDIEEDKDALVKLQRELKNVYGIEIQLNL